MMIGRQNVKICQKKKFIMVLILFQSLSRDQTAKNQFETKENILYRLHIENFLVSSIVFL